MTSALLSQVEEETLSKLDKLIDWYHDNKPSIKHVVITKKQHSALKRIEAKKLIGDLYRRIGHV